MDKPPNEVVPKNTEEDRWGSIEQSIEHHRLSKLYNDLNRNIPEVKWISMQNSEVDLEKNKIILENESKKQYEFEADCSDRLWRKLSTDDGKQEHAELNSNVLGSNSDDSVSESRGFESLQSKMPQTNLSRVPDTNLLKNILSRTRSQKDDGDEQFEINLRCVVPPLDLSWLEKDDWKGSKDSLNFKRDVENRSDLKQMKQDNESINDIDPNNNKASHLKLCQAESDPLVGSPDLVQDINRSNCSSPERLEHDSDKNCELQNTNTDQNSFPKCNRINSTETPKSVSNIIIKKDSQDSGFQEFSDPKVTAGVHTNGNQNSRLRRKCMYRRASQSIGKPETIEEESMGISELINKKFSTFESFRSNQEIKWNTMDSIDLPFSRFRQMADERSLSVRINEPTSIDTSQVSFNVSRHGDNLVSEVTPVVVSSKPDGAKSEANHNSKVIGSKVKKGMKVVDGWGDEEEEEEDDEEEEGKKKSIKRCYCFICGLNCEIWFC